MMREYLNKVVYVWDKELISECDRIPAVAGRASMVHNLISAFGLLDEVRVVHSTLASSEELQLAHSERYLEHLDTLVNIDEEDYMATAQDENFGLGYDCPVLPRLSHLVRRVAGGSMVAARCLALGVTRVAINWCGGWHHARRLRAAGYCYVNDIVLAIETLRQTFPRVLYIDLDVHHGDGVEEMYSACRSVLTLSFHLYEPGFYPAQGELEYTGVEPALGYSCNVPLQTAYTDHTLKQAFRGVVKRVWESFAPLAVVVQCGADALANDPGGGAALTACGYVDCVRTLLKTGVPTLLLGGGGYIPANSARLWASLTALAVGKPLAASVDIPEHTDWPCYGPYYTLEVPRALARDANTSAYLQHCIAHIAGNLAKHVRGDRDQGLNSYSMSGPNWSYLTNSKIKEETDVQTKTGKPEEPAEIDARSPDVQLDYEESHHTSEANKKTIDIYKFDE